MTDPISVRAPGEAEDANRVSAVIHDRYGERQRERLDALDQPRR